MTTFCLIHGAWHEPSCWDWLVPHLARRAHDVVTPELPLHDPEASYEQRVMPAAEALAGLDDDTVIVGHSQGSAYSSLLAARRPNAVLVHLCPRLGGFEPPAEAPDTFRSGIPFPETRTDGTSAWDSDVAIQAMYRRLSPDQARSLADHLRPMAPPPDEFPLDSHPGNETVLIYAADDELFEPEWERFMARELLGIEPIELAGGHFPMVEDPEGLGALLDRIARDRAPDQGTRGC